MPLRDSEIGRDIEDRLSVDKASEIVIQTTCSGFLSVAVIKRFGPKATWRKSGCVVAHRRQTITVEGQGKRKEIHFTALFIQL